MAETTYEKIELTPELLVDCATAQNFPVELVQQLGNSRISFSKADTLVAGGFLNLNAWSVYPAWTSLSEEEKAAGVEPEHVGWTVQWTLSAWVHPETLLARRITDVLDRDRLLKFSLKLRKQTYYLNELSIASQNVLNTVHSMQVSGKNVAAEAFYGEDFTLQFDLTPWNTSVKVNGVKTPAIRLFGDGVYMEGFTFKLPSRERGSLEVVRAAEKPVMAVPDLLAAIAAKRSQPAPGQVLARPAMPAAAVASPGAGEVGEEEIPF